MIAMIGASDQSCWLAAACNILLLQEHTCLAWLARSAGPARRAFARKTAIVVQS